MTAAEKRIRGTREWAVADIDCCTGCSHGCRYCYARYDGVVKKKRVSASEWQHPEVRSADVHRSFPLYPGTVMFPANHDIQPEILADCIRLLHNLLAPGNSILIVSKPHLLCIEEICRTFNNSRRQILFRFSITAIDNRILQFWEPAAPAYEERLASLRHAYSRGFQTSISIEPMLESEKIEELVDQLSPFVSHSIWIGKMNKIKKRVSEDTPQMAHELQRIRKEQNDENIAAIYHRLKNNSLIRWKESIKEVVGLELLRQPGLDI
ncbi:radical SAM protein [Desulfopila inferna]|uniref:radical SAM protein n=1 Tax=Desulfopila inferna TaxID=468528 RepID=UPI001963EA56|nr:radical SAM protein [Desulfopila inferna]MBM9604727.1 hypothetical protein [Desulfopila inferna]